MSREGYEILETIAQSPRSTVRVRCSTPAPHGRRRERDWRARWTFNLTSGILSGVSFANQPPKSPTQLARSLAERAANEEAAAEGRALPFPNPWDSRDPTKVRSGATAAEIEASYRAFRELCQPVPRKQHRL